MKEEESSVALFSVPRSSKARRRDGQDGAAEKTVNPANKRVAIKMQLAWNWSMSLEFLAASLDGAYLAELQQIYIASTHVIQYALLNANRDISSY